MPIDFHDPRNMGTYATRDATDSWSLAMTSLLDPRNSRVADIGCGGGIYSIAWKKLGAASVTGVDLSEQMLSAAREHTQQSSDFNFVQGDATDTGLPQGAFDVVFERALIHHLKDYTACFAEARRLLRDDGVLLVQDRTPDDVAQPASADHLRGFFFERFPRLKALEAGRRPDTPTVTSALRDAGLRLDDVRTLWETRRSYPSFEVYADDLAARTGRSILHELSDAALQELIAHVRARVPAGPLVERDRWTLWLARRA